MLDRLVENWPLKLLALVLALGIWVAITGESLVIQDFHVPLEVQLPPGRTLASSPPTTVTVRLRGPEIQFRRLDPLRLALRLDLQNGSGGERDVMLSSADLAGVPQGLEIAFIEPSRVRLAVEPLLRRELPITLDLIGETPSGYRVYHASVQPPRIAIEGPESEVHAVTRLSSSPIRLDGHTTNFVQRVSASTDQPHVRVLEARPLEARIVIDTTPIERTFDALPVTLVSGTAARLDPPVARVTLAGPEALLQRLDPRRLRVVADDVVASRGAGAIPLELRVEFQDTPLEDRVRLEVRKLDPQQVLMHPVPRG